MGILPMSPADSHLTIFPPNPTPTPQACAGVFFPFPLP